MIDEEDPITNNEYIIDESCEDIGAVLRAMRDNQGWTLKEMSKRIDLSTAQISNIERCLSELPREPILRDWFSKLGCKKNLPALMRVAAGFRVNHTLKLKSGDISNRDIVRVIEAYKTNTLSDRDRNLLVLIGR